MNDDYPFLRDLRSPVTAQQLRPLDRRCRVVQFGEPLNEEDFKKLGTFMKKYPRIILRIYSHIGISCNLDFLRHFPNHRNLCFDAFLLDDISGIEHACPDLEVLSVGPTKTKRHSLSYLRRFPQLRELHVGGQAKDLDVVSTLKNLETLTLRSLTLPDLSLLRPLKNLQWLAVKLGGTKDLSALADVRKLRYLELWMIKGLADLSVLAKLKSLQFLFLQALKNVTELPSFARLTELRRVLLWTMKGLHDLTPIAKAPKLEELSIGDMGHLKPEDLRPFAGHPTLLRASIGLNSAKKNAEAAKLIGVAPFKPLSEFKFR